MTQLCEVCGAPAQGVYSTSLGAISHAYCAGCAAAGREPWSTLVGGLFGVQRGQTADWVQPVIDATCKHYGKTEDELWDDVERLERELEEYEKRERDA